MTLIKSITNFMKMLTISSSPSPPPSPPEVPESGQSSCTERGDGDHDVKYGIKLVPPPTTTQITPNRSPYRTHPQDPGELSPSRSTPTLSMAEIIASRPWWMNEGHPSRDNYGRKIHNYKEYIIRKRNGDVGQIRSDLILYKKTQEYEAEDEDFFDVASDAMISTEFFEPPTFSLLMDLLPDYCHRFLDLKAKKDARTWLWKGAKGRVARVRMRSYLKMCQEDGENTTVEYLIGL